MTDSHPLPPVIDADQLRRIESTHRGFFYQHLFAVGCLLVAQRSGVTRVIVERDEDLELDQAPNRIYLQIKTRSTQLQWSDISSTLDNFAHIRNEHSSGARNGSPSFFIVCNVAPSASLQDKYAGTNWPTDVRILSPAIGEQPDFLPPVWPTIRAALTWCREQADAIPFVSVAGDVLVWKLAAIVQCACTGEGDFDHSFLAEDLPTLFSQVILQLQGFPDTARPYLPHSDEPPYTSASRLRCITGLSGSGKTAWVAEASVQMPDSAVYFDVGDTPAPALAAGIVRETAGRLFTDSAETRNSFLLPGYSGLDALRALDTFLSSKERPITVFLDNCQRCSSDTLLAIATATKYLRWVFVSQPCPALGAFLPRINVQAEELRGWNPDSIASRFKASNISIDYGTAERVRALTGGLPLFVQSLMALSLDHYDGDVGHCCDDISASVHAATTAQDAILSAIKDKLSVEARRVIVALSLAEFPLLLDELKVIAAEGLSLDERVVTQKVRELHSWGLIQYLRAKEASLHDAFRPMAAELQGETGEDTVLAIRQALKSALVKSLEVEPDYHRQCALIRLLPVIGETEALVELASSESEYLRELGLIPEVSAVLRTYINRDDSHPRDKFWALDTLALWANDEKEIAALDGITTEMDALYNNAGLGRKERAALATKRLLRFGRSGDPEAILAEMQVVQDILDDDPEHRRILVYDCAVALFYAKQYEDAIQIARGIASEYFEELGFEDGLASKNLPEIWDGIKKNDDTQSNLKRLADCLELLAMARDKQGHGSFPARLHAHKFYLLAGAFRSAMRVGQDCADELLRLSNNPWEARNFIEQSLLPAVRQYKLLEYVIPVRSQYAVVVAYSGDVLFARKEINALLAFDIQNEDRRNEVKRQAELIEEIARGYNPYLERQQAMERMRMRAQVKRQQKPDTRQKVGRNDPCPCGSGKKFKKCCLGR